MAQQRYLVQRQAGKRWHWSAIRPSVVGASLGNPMNGVKYRGLRVDQ